MEIEKKLVVSAPRDKVWAMLMDPHVMTSAVPGMQSIDVISPTEYTALMKVKISFISAKFKLHTHIVEQREPEFLRAEGTGEDTSVASSLKQTTEVFLTDTSDGGTELRIKVNVDVLGRLGTFGLSVMKTKADRMWDSFGKNLAAQLDGQEPGQPDATGADTSKSKESTTPGEPKTGPANEQNQSNSRETPAREYEPADYDTTDELKPKGWFSRLLGGNRTSVNRVPAQSASVIRIEIRQFDRTVAVEWPVEAANQCQEWLRDLLTRTK